MRYVACWVRVGVYWAVRCTAANLTVHTEDSVMIPGILTQEELKRAIHYDPETGVFTRIKSDDFHWKSTRHTGEIKNVPDNEGYIRIRLKNKRYLLHVLAWLYVNGVLPDKSIDHINGVKTDNRIANLRLASLSENAQNRRKPSGKSGFLGVYKTPSGYVAKIRYNGKQRRIGKFYSPEKAHEAYVEEKRKHHPFGTL